MTINSTADSAVFLDMLSKFATPLELFNPTGTSFNYQVQKPERIFIIGCGGTGGWFMPKLIKILNDAKAKFLIDDKVEIILIDKDTVSTKNLARQNFIAQDIGESKAKVMCKRYSPHLAPGMKMYFVEKFVSHKTIIAKIPEDKRDGFIDFAALLKASTAVTYIFNFIDNAITRQVVHAAALLQGNNGRHCYVLDVANNQYNGQLNFSSYRANFDLPYQISTKRYDLNHLSGYFSNVADYVARAVAILPSSFFYKYPSHLDDLEYVKIVNCADDDVNAVSQLFNANDTAATICASVFTNMLESKNLKYGTFNFFTGQDLSIKATDRICNFEDNNHQYNDYFIQAIKKEVDNDHQLKATEQPYHMMLNRLAEQYKEMSTYGYRFPVHLLLEKFNDNFAKYEPT